MTKFVNGPLRSDKVNTDKDYPACVHAPHWLAVQYNCTSLLNPCFTDHTSTSAPLRLPSCYWRMAWPSLIKPTSLWWYYCTCMFWIVEDHIYFQSACRHVGRDSQTLTLYTQRLTLYTGIPGAHSSGSLLEHLSVSPGRGIFIFVGIVSWWL